MSTFYGQVEGMAKTVATRRGSQYINVSAQSWHGSVITKLTYDENDVLNIELQLNDDSSSRGYTYFRGNMEELKQCFNEWKELRVKEVNE